MRLKAKLDAVHRVRWLQFVCVRVHRWALYCVRDCGTHSHMCISYGWLPASCCYLYMLVLRCSVCLNTIRWLSDHMDLLLHAHISAIHQRRRLRRQAQRWMEMPWSMVIFRPKHIIRLVGRHHHQPQNPPQNPTSELMLNVNSFLYDYN